MGGDKKQESRNAEIIDILLEKNRGYKRQLADEKEKFARSEEKNNHLRESLAEAINNLRETSSAQGNPVDVLNDAEAALAQGDTSKAESIYQGYVDQKLSEGEQANKDAARALVSFGALAYLHDTEKALAQLRLATKLDPKNPKAWNNLGILLYRKGSIDEAIEAYTRVGEIGEETCASERST